MQSRNLKQWNRQKWASFKQKPTQIQHGLYHPSNPTCPLKRDYFNRKYIFQPSIFSGYVSFRQCTYFQPSIQIFRTPKCQRYSPDRILYVLVGGFNPLEKYLSNWIISPGFRVKIKKGLKSPPHKIYITHYLFSCVVWYSHSPIYPKPTRGLISAKTHTSTVAPWFRLIAGTRSLA